MRAFLIVPDTKSITKLDTSGDWDAIRGLLEAFRITPILIHHPDGAADAVYVDDHQNEADEDPRCWFQLDDLGPLARSALVIGVDRNRPCPVPRPIEDGIVFYEDLVGPDYRGGEHCDARILVDELTARITFSKRRFRGYREVGERIYIVAPIVEEC